MGLGKSVEAELKTSFYWKGIKKIFLDETQIAVCFRMVSGFWASFYSALEKREMQASNEVSIVWEDNVESCQMGLGKNNCNTSS